MSQEFFNILVVAFGIISVLTNIALVITNEGLRIKLDDLSIKILEVNLESKQDDLDRQKSIISVLQHLQNHTKIDGMLYDQIVKLTDIVIDQSGDELV